MIMTAPASERPSEHQAYLRAGADHIYTVHHAAKGVRRGAVLIAGPMGAKRERAYRSIVLLSRTMADAGCDVLRFDYRGIGESTGDFGGLCLTDWLDDVHACAARLRSLAPGAPLVLLGIRTGALLVARAFRGDGSHPPLGDAMTLWAAPKNGRDLLQDTLRRTLMADMIANPNQPRRTREEIAEALERGENVNVDGYPWSKRLWMDSLQHELVLPGKSEKRTWKVLDFKGLPSTRLEAGLEENQESVAAERFWENTPMLIPNSPTLFKTTLALLDELTKPHRGQGGGSA